MSRNKGRGKFNTSLVVTVNPLQEMSFLDGAVHLAGVVKDRAKERKRRLWRP